MLSRRLAASLARPGPRIAVRALGTTAARSSAPSMGDINPDASNVESFNRRQRSFREDLVKKQRQREASALARITAGKEAAASGSTGSESAGSGAPQGLGSLSTASGGIQDESSHRKPGPLTNLIYGTKEGREMDAQIEASFSAVLARGKYVHSIVFHTVKPDKVEEYVALVGGWYPRLVADPKAKVHLVGSWRTEVGDCDTFVHIWEYPRYQGYHEFMHTIAENPEHPNFERRLRSLLISQNTSLMQEFSFWPTTPPRRLGGVFELRSYTLHPGNLLEWETHWRRGLKARREVMEGVGAWFVQIGDLNTVHHLWQFANLEERKIRREKSWGIEGWSDTVHKTVPLIQAMRSRIMLAMPWSPVA